MKILHVGAIKPSCNAGGPNHSIRGLTASQAKSGMQVGLLPSLALQSGVSMEVIAGVHMLESPRKPHYNPWFISKNWISYIRKEFGEPDLVNFHSTYIPFHIALARQIRHLGWPYIVTPRGGMTRVAQNIKKPKKLISNILFFRSYIKYAAAIHALSDAEAEQIQSLFTVNKIITAPNAVNEELFDMSDNLKPARLSDFAEGVHLMLGFVGRLDVYIKGIDLLLQALAKVKSQLSAPMCKLFIVGPFFSNKDRDYCISTIQSLGLKDIVKVVGSKYGQEKWSYFLACDLYIQTSRSEGMPMSVLEAMAMGRPCLVTSETRMGSIVREGGGWECEANPKSIASAIKSIYETKDSLKRLGQQSRKLIQSRFTWPIVARQLKEEYLQIIKKQGHY